MYLIYLALAPVVAIMLFIYYKDKYEKEPKKLLVKLFFLGVLTTIPAGILESFFPVNLEREKNLIVLFFYALFGVALIEEGVKYFVLSKFTKNREEFNERYDGIVYAVFVSLGFAALENILYVISSGFFTGIFRAFTAVPLHAICAVIMGYYYGMAKFETEETLKRKYKLKSFIMPVAIHGIYDFLLFTKMGIFALLFLGFLVFIYIYSFKKIKSSIKKDNEARETERVEQFKEKEIEK